MKQIAFYFYDKDRMVAQLIEYFTGGGNMSHVKIGFDHDPETGICDDYVEALGGRIFGQNGVLPSNRLETFHEGKYEPKRPPYKVVIDVTDEKHDQAKKSSDLIEGMGYGYLGLLKWVVKIWLWIVRIFSIKHRGKFCSELAMEIYNAATGCELDTSQSPNVVYAITSSYSMGQKAKT